MAGLYDAYQLENSRGVRPYQGSTMNELIKVSDVFQNRYDTSVAGMEGLSEYLQNAKSLGKDTPLLNQRMKAYQGQLDQWSQRPDLENVTQDVYKAGRKFANEYQNFAQQQKLVTDYQKELDQKVDEKKISRERANDLLAASYDTYQGLKYDQTTGKYSGQFQGIGAANEVDYAAKVKQWVGDIAERKGGSIIESPEGDYFIKKGSTFERITPDMINSAIQSGLALDSEVKSDLTQRTQLASWKGSKLKLQDFGEVAQKEIQKKADRTGVPVSQVLAEMKGKKEYRDVLGNVQQLAMKYAKDNRTSAFEYDGFTTRGQQNANKIIEEAPLILPSAAIRFAEKDKNISNIQKGIADVDEQLANISTKLNPQNIGRLDKDEITLYRQQKINLEAQKLAKESIIDGAGDAVAKRMGYSSQAELLRESSKTTRPEEKFNIPKVGDTYKGLDGKTRTIASIANDNYQGIESYKVTYNDGTTRTINDIGDKASGTSKSQKQTISDFYSQRRTEVKDNAEKYAIQPSSLVLNKQESDALKKGILANPAAVQWFKAGESSTTSHLPDDFEIGSIKVMKQNGSVYFDVNELSTEKGKQGTPTGKNYMLQIGPGNTAAPMIASRLLKMDAKGNINSNKDALAAASVLLNGNWSGMLSQLQNNEKIPVTTSKGTIIGYVERKGFSNDPSQSRYKLYDPRGLDVSEKIPLNARQDIGLLSNYIERVTAIEEEAEVPKTKAPKK